MGAIKDWISAKAMTTDTRQYRMDSEKNRLPIPHLEIPKTFLTATSFALLVNLAVLKLIKLMQESTIKKKAAPVSATTILKFPVGDNRLMTSSEDK